VPRGFEIDWVVVRVITVRRAMAIVGIGLVAAALLVYAYFRLDLPPEALARRSIERAQLIRERTVTQGVPEMWNSELKQAEMQLEAARTAYGDEQWSASTQLANGSRQRFQALLGAARHEVVGVGQIFSLEGRVSVQRAGKSEWHEAHERMPVFNGDFVRTGREGSAEILFADGSLYRIAPNSLLEIHQRTRENSEGSGRVKMMVGRINVYTSDSPSTVTTDTSETEVQGDSRVAVDVGDHDRSTTVAAYAGGARVRGTQGSEVMLGSREQVSAQSDGTMSEKRRIPRPPIPLEPVNNAGFELIDSPLFDLRWRTDRGTHTVHLQVSRSNRFLEGHLDIDIDNLHKNWARLKAVAPGSYFWRIATIDEHDLRSEWSSVRRFQVLSPNRQLQYADVTPPELTVRAARQLGHMFIVEGRSEVGATVTINGEAVELDPGGRFRKMIEVDKPGETDLVVAAVDPSGNRTERRQRVYVEVY